MPDIARATISATQTAALFNASKYTTPWMLYHYLKGNEVEKLADNRMDWGTRFELPILEAAADDLKLVKMTPNRDESGKQKYFTRGLFGCHRDADIFDPNRGKGALETKVVFDYRVWNDEWKGGDEPPRMHELQLQTQMYVGDEDGPFTHGVLTAWIAGELVHFHREPIPELWAAMDEAAADMFDRVKNDREPDPLGNAAELPLLNKLYPPKADKALNLTEIKQSDEPEAVAENIRRVSIVEQARAMNYHAEQRLFHEKAEKQAKDFMRGLALDNGIINLPFGARVDLKLQKRGAYEVKPTSFVTIKAFVPDNLPDDLIAAVADEDSRPI